MPLFPAEKAALAPHMTLSLLLIPLWLIWSIGLLVYFGLWPD